MGPNPSMISFTLKAALAASLVLTVSCLLLTAGATPAAGAADTSSDAGSPPLLIEQVQDRLLPPRMRHHPAP